MERVTDRQYWMDSILKNNLNTAIYNLKRDWDYVFVISGSGLVRIGKSMLAQQIGYYISSYFKTPFNIDNIIFGSKNLITTAHKLPKNSVLIYDEAREALDAKKSMRSLSQDLQDFFAECGMYNHFMILVLPDYFELYRRLATTRSDALINVFRVPQLKHDKELGDVSEYKRGYFEFYSREKKKRLYIDGKKKYEDYNIGIKLRNFWGNFREHWIINPEEYTKKKLEFIRRDKGKEKVKQKENARNKIIINMKKKGLTDELIGEYVDLTAERIRQIRTNEGICVKKIETNKNLPVLHQ